MKKGQTVFYSTGRDMVRARVMTRHRDGTVTVRALFYHDARTHQDRPGFLGFLFRMDADDLALQTV